MAVIISVMLQLGCGAGLSGIYALLHGSVVHFQDYVRALFIYYYY